MNEEALAHRGLLSQWWWWWWYIAPLEPGLDHKVQINPPLPVALRPDSGSWPSLIGLHDHAGWTHHTR